MRGPLCALVFVSLVPHAVADFVERVQVLKTWEGEQAGDQFGWVTALVGDQDGDGIGDLMITAPTNDEVASNAGKVYIYSSVTGDLLRSYLGGRANDQLGNNCADVGPIDADTTHDLLLGAPGAARGRAFLYSGATGQELMLFRGEAAGDQFGAAVRPAGDLNGDGKQELLIGAPQNDFAAANAGRVYIFDGAAPHDLLGTVEGLNGGDQFGSILGPVGDQDGDNVPDFAVGAPGAGTGGLAYIVSGATFTRLCTLQPRSNAVNFGSLFLSSPGDLNDDGTPDVYVSDFNDQQGRAYFYSYDGGACNELLRLVGDSNGDGFGIGNATAGDVNGDGISDILIGSWQDSDGANNAGSADVFLNDGTLVRTITSTTFGETFGFDAHTMDDINGDGWPDFLISAAWNNINGAQTGVVYLIAGESPFCESDFDGDGTVSLTDLAVVLQSFGEAGEGAGDANGDGVTDLSDLAIVLREFGQICLSE